MRKEEVSPVVHLTAVVVLLALLVTGCVSIPPEAPELSVEVGNRISAMQDTHLKLLHEFFNMKRAEVDRFVNEEWLPLFAQEVFADPRMSSAWDTVVAENEPQQNVEFLVRVGPRLQERINAKRVELTAPLDEIEDALVARIQEDYDQVKAANNAVTSFLMSATKVAENRNRYLAKIGITEEKVARVIDKIDAAVAAGVTKAELAESLAAKVDAYKEQGQTFVSDVRRLMDSL